MAADASIYGSITRPTEPLDQYGKVLNLKALMGQSKLQDLQTQNVEQDMAEKQGVRDVFNKAPAGATLESLLPDVMRASPATGISYQGKVLENRKNEATLKHTEAQTQDLTAGHIAGAWAALAKGGGSDESVKQAHDMMAPIVGEQAATAATQKLLGMDPSARLAYSVAQAGQHKVGQEALKIFFPNAALRDTGGEVQPVSTSTLPGGPVAGTPIPGSAPIPKTATPGEKMVDARTRELNGIMEGSVTKASDTLIDSIGKGDIELRAPPVNARNPVMLQRYDETLARVKEKYPNWSQEMYPTIKKTVADFAVGKSGQTVKALNTATDHLETLRELADAQKNGNIQLFNKIANQYASNTGNPAPSNLAVAAQVIGGEIVKGIVGAGGGVGERERAEAAFSNVKSPADLNGALDTVTKLMGGQFKGMQKQYEAGTYGRKDFAEKYLSPAAQKALEAAQAPKKEAAPASAGGLVSTIKSDDDYAKLKSGSEFIGPDGVKRRKP